MADLFPCRSLGELAISVSDTHPMKSDRLIFLNTSDIYNGKLLHKEYTEVAHWPGQAKKSVALNDILFSEIRPANGRWALVKESAEDIVVSTKLMVIRSNPAKLLAEFLYLFITSNNITGWLQHLADSRSGTFPQITFDQVASLQIPLPPLSEQRRIAHILCTLDDKIENNRKTAKTLEAMAQAIFQSWFVDFDPVRAKMSGESPESICKRLKLTPEILDLFPDRLVDSELGEIPEGWVINVLEKVANVIDCLHSKKPERRATGFPLLQLENIRDDGLLDMTDTYFIDEETYKKWTSRLEAREGTCVITNVGRVGAVAQVPQGLNAALGRNMTAICCKKEFPFNFYIFYCLRSEPMRAEIINKTDCGTILDALNVRSIPKLSFVLPPRDLVRNFDLVASSLRHKTDQMLKNTIYLSKARDTLLPKLISGEIRVPEAERLIENIEG